MNKTIIIPVGWTTESSNFPSYLKMIFSPEDIAKIKRIMQIVKTEELNNARLDFVAEFFEDEKCTEENDFSANVNELIISENSIFFYAQNEHESSIQFESVEISLEEIECPMDKEALIQLWLDAEEELRNDNDVKCLVMKDTFMEEYKKLSPADKQHVDDYLESCGA
jgi:hypothetical protein